MGTAARMTRVRAVAKNAFTELPTKQIPKNHHEVNEQYSIDWYKNLNACGIEKIGRCFGTEIIMRKP